jgi:hypothetical protein
MPETALLLPHIALLPAEAAAASSAGTAGKQAVRSLLSPLAVPGNSAASS